MRTTSPVLVWQERVALFPHGESSVPFTLPDSLSGSLTRSLVIPAIRLFFLLQHERTTCCSRDRLCRLFVPCYRAQLVLRVRHESSEQHLVVLPLLCPPPSPLSPLIDRHRVLSFFLLSRSWRTIAAVSVVPSSLVLAHSARAARTPREVCILYILPSCA